MFKTGLEELAEKTAARAGLRLIRRAVNAGNFGQANRLAKTPGVLKALDPSLVEREGNILIHAGRNPGHQIKHLGGGAEQVATLVADPRHGVVVRNTHRGPSAVTVPEQVGLKADLGRLMTEKNFPYAPKFHEAFTGPAGHRMRMTEYVPGTPTGDRRGEAMRHFQTFAREHGFDAHDITSKGNVVTAPDGTPKVLDAVVSRSATPGRHTYRGQTSNLPRKSPGEVMREVFNPSTSALDAYEATLDRARAAARRRAA